MFHRFSSFLHKGIRPGTCEVASRFLIVLLCVTAISVGRKVLTELLLRTEGLELLLAAREAGTLSVRMMYKYTLKY